MSTPKPSARRTKAEGGTDINLTPIMNLMVVLIPMLLQVAQFTQLALLQYLPPAEADAGGGGQDQDEPPPDQEEIQTLDLLINLIKGDTIQISMFNSTELGDKFYEIPGHAGGYNMDALQDSLYSIKTNIVGKATGRDSTLIDPDDASKGWDSFNVYKYQDGRNVKITGDSETPFQVIVNVMDLCRWKEVGNEQKELFPQYILAKIG